MLLTSIDIGGTYVKYGAVSFNSTTSEATVLWQSKVATNAHLGLEAGLATITAVAQEALARTPDCESIGIGVPGIVDPRTRHVQHPPNLPGWLDVDLIGHLRQSPLPNPSLPIYVENDANCGAIAEWKAGAGKGLEAFVYVTLGTGIGGGLILDGRLYTGEHGEAGELGHMLVGNRKPETGNRRTGKLEDIVGIRGIVERYGEEVDVHVIDERAQAGEARAREVLEETGAMLGSALGDALAVLGVRTVVAGGGVSLSRIVLDAIEKELRQVPLPTLAQNVRLLGAHFQDQAGLVGAALLGVA
jgi:glucokinase